MLAIRVREPGGPEVMRVEEVPLPEPGPGQARVKILVAGVNYTDVQRRSGRSGEAMPFTPGREAAGTVDAIGPGVDLVQVGDRVGWSSINGAYATHAVLPADRLVPIPDAMSFQDAAASLLQGMTAHFLTHSTYPLQPGDTCLVHAAAGGMGLWLCQVAKLRGARVIGTTSTREKADLARAAGADEVILYTEQDFAAEVRRLTGGRGLQVVYDGVGQDTWAQSLDCLAPRGYLALYGAASGPVPPIDSGLLGGKGSLFLTRPLLGHYILTREELLDRATDVLGWVAGGQVKLRIDRTYALADAPVAHRDLESRATTGKLLLLIDGA